MASTNGHGSPNSIEELERDAERTRADLAHTVDELRNRISDTATDIRERVSPSALKQDVKDYVNQTGQQFYHSIETRARENPLQAVAIAAGLAYPVWRIVTSIPAPLLLIGAGIALSSRSGHGAVGGGNRLLEQGREKFDDARAGLADRARSASASMQDATQQARQTAQDAAARARGAVQDTASRARDAVSDVASRTKEQVSSTMGRVSNTMSSTVESVSGTVGDAVSSARGAANSARDAVGNARETATRMASDAASAVSDVVSSSYQSTAEAAAYARDQALRMSQQTRETFVQTMERNPLLVGAAGLAIGALIASAIPSTAPENRVFGDTNEELKRRAREMASRGYNAARETAGELYEDTVRAAKEQGLSVDALRQAADDLGGKVRNVAERATGISASDKQSGSTDYAQPKII